MRLLMMSLMAFCMVGLYAQENDEPTAAGGNETETTSEVAAADDVSAEATDSEEAPN